MIVLWIILGVIVLIFVGSAIDNSRPVSSWSDEKLQRLIPAYSKLNKWDKVAAIEEELNKRQQVDKTAEALTNVRDEIHDMAEKMNWAIAKISQLNKINMPEAAEIYFEKMDKIKDKLSQSQKDSGEADQIAMSELYEKYKNL